MRESRAPFERLRAVAPLFALCPIALRLALAAALLAASASFGVSAQSAGNPAPAASGVSIATRPLSEVAIRQQADAPAGVQSLNETRIASEIAAPILEIPVRPGETLARGAIVVRLDSRDYDLELRRIQAVVEAATARVKLAQTQLDRSRQLARENFISSEALNQRETEADVVRADLRVAEAQLEGARRNLAKTVLRAPFRAIVTERNGSVGALAQPGTPLVTLVDADRIEVVANVATRDTGSLRAADSIVFVTPSGRFPVKLARVSPVIDRESRTTEARLAFAGTPAPVGAEGRITWNDAQALVPPEFIVRRGESLGVFVVENDIAKFVPLPRAQEGRPAPIELPASARVVVEGQRTLQPNQKVSLAPRPAGSR